MLFDGLGQHARKEGRRYVETTRLVYAFDVLEQPAHAGTVQCGDPMNRRPRRKLETPIEFRLHAFALVDVQPIPFVDGDHQPGAAINCVAEQMQILLDESLGCIDHDDRDVGGIDRSQRFDD